MRLLLSKASGLSNFAPPQDDAPIASFSLVTSGKCLLEGKQSGKLFVRQFLCHAQFRIRQESAA